MVSDHNKNNEYFDFPDTPYGYLVVLSAEDITSYKKVKALMTLIDANVGMCWNIIVPCRSIPQFITLTSMDLEQFWEVTVKTQIQISKDELNSQHTQIPDNRQIINQLSQQGTVAEETIANIQQDTREFWDIVDQYKPNTGEDNQTTSSQDVIEMDRLMMLVDERRAIGRK